jgi:DNA-binding NarL/FixJ family response regulator
MPSPLTPRETEMVRKLADGKVYKQIAGDFDLQVSTVRTHLYNTYKKLGVADRAQAVLLATGNGWL